MNEAEIHGYSYWVGPWGATQANCWDQGLPDDDRLLGGAFGTTQTELLSSLKAVPWGSCGGLRWGKYQIPIIYVVDTGLTWI